MLIFTMAMAMMLAMLIATFLRLHTEARHVRINEQWRNRPRHF